MTETSPSPTSRPVDPDGSVRLSADLLNLIVDFLTPMFLGGSAGDVRMARLAAIEMVCAYRACSYVELLSVMQLVAFSLTTLDSLSLSMADDLSLSMILRLRGNANALHRSAERHRCTRETSQQDFAACQHDNDAPQEAPSHPPIPAAAFQASDRPAETQASPPKTQPQVPRSHASSPAITPQGLWPSSAPVFPETASQQIAIPPCHLAPPSRVSMRAAALGSSASYLMSGAEPPTPFVHSADVRTTYSRSPDGR